MPGARVILSAITGFGVCPGWLRSPVHSPAFEDISIDTALSADRRLIIRGLREALIAELRLKWRQDPTSDLLTGQLVRLGIDQSDYGTVSEVLTDCQASAWLCESLTGLVVARGGDRMGAEAHFRRADIVLPDALRCAMDDIELLLPERERIVYVDDFDCESRSSVNRWYWWLSKPLWSEASHPRWTEHRVRQIDIHLRAALPRDERFSWVDSLGVDARRAMLLRYGTPSYNYWGGPFTDSVRSGYAIRQREYLDRPNPPYVAHEYRIEGRQSLTVRAAAAFAPERIRPDDWLEPNTGWSDLTYWPWEHMPFVRAITSLPTPQTQVLRRYDHALLGVASSALDHVPLKRSATDSLQMQFLYSAAPETVTVVAARGFRFDGQPVRMHGRIPGSNGVLSLEVPSPPSRAEPSLRTRVGTEAASLSRLAPRELAVSAPLLMQLSDSTDPIPDPVTAFDAMLPTDQITAGQPLNLYWETYGVADGDTVQHAVWLQRITPQSPERRLAIKLGFATDRNTPVSVSWEESRIGANAKLIPDGLVPVIGRTMTISTESLRAGEYRLEVAVARKGQPPVRAERLITVR